MSDQPEPHLLLANRLRLLRFEKKKTVREVQAATGISNAYLCQLENGQIKNPSVFKLGKLCRFYDETIEHLTRYII